MIGRKVYLEDPDDAIDEMIREKRGSDMFNGFNMVTFNMVLEPICEAVRVCINSLPYRKERYQD